MAAEVSLYFIALIPPEPLRSETWRMKEQMHAEYGSKASMNSPAHITLHMPFEIKENREKAVIETLQELAEGFNSFPIELNGYGAFPPRVLFLHVVPSEMLSRLQTDVHLAMKRGFNIFNADYKKKAFHPHITLAFRDLKKSAFEEAWNALKDRPYQARWQATAFTLLKHDGKQWQELAQAYFADAGHEEEE